MLYFSGSVIQKNNRAVVDAWTRQINLTDPQFRKVLDELPRLADYLSTLFPEQEKLIREKIST